MRDLDRILGQIGDSLRREARDSRGGVTETLFAQAMHRAARRRAVKATGLPLVATGVVVGLFALPLSMPFTGPTPDERSARVPIASVPNDAPPKGLGFWPNVSEEESAQLCDGLTGMKWQDMAAAAFVGEALGWSNTAERDVRRVGRDLIVKQQGNFPSTFHGGGTPDSPWITLELSRLRGDRCWWVTGVSDPDDDAQLAVTLRSGSLNARWDMPDGATRADLLVVDRNGRELIPGDQAATAAQADGFEGPGFALLLWRGLDGSVISAAGATLPDGDHSRIVP